MRAYIDDSSPIFAGTKLLARNYGGRMQLTRVGDELRVICHNSYVLVERTVPAGFLEWEDGAHVCFDITQRASYEIAAITKDTLAASINITMPLEGMSTGLLAVTTEDSVTHMVDTAVYFTEPVTLHRWLDEGIEGDPADVLTISDRVLRDAAGALKQVTGWHFNMIEWTMRNHGEGKPIELTCEEQKARVLLMPCRTRLESGAGAEVEA